MNLAPAHISIDEPFLSQCVYKQWRGVCVQRRDSIQQLAQLLGVGLLPPHRTL
ncbi:hypothetical protein D3C72_2334350 [compost metagenome]